MAKKPTAKRQPARKDKVAVANKKPPATEDTGRALGPGRNLATDQPSGSETGLGGRSRAKGVERGDGEPKDLGRKVLLWHHGLAQVTGGLSLRIAKHTMVRTEVQEWVDSVRAIAQEMQDWVNGE
jgi:hypothetical protein